MTGHTALLAAAGAAARELKDASESADGDETIWSRAGTRFAVLRGETLELRLGPAIAAAALRTPDTRASTRGPDWIAFAPPTLVGHALDRLEAWFAAAHRRATPS